jgi:HK97 gp10 family phage protein
MAITIKGLEALSKALATRATDKGQIVRVVQKNAQELYSNAVRTAPKRSGYLRSSMQVQMQDSGMTAKIYPTADYAPYVEYGTRFMDAQPYMRPSFEKQAPKFKADLDKLVK